MSVKIKHKEPKPIKELPIRGIIVQEAPFIGVQVTQYHDRSDFLQVTAFDRTNKSKQFPEGKPQSGTGHIHIDDVDEFCAALQRLAEEVKNG